MDKGKDKDKNTSIAMGVILSMAGCLAMVTFPQISLDAAKSGISLWLGTVVPAMLPFFICAGLMQKLGVPQKIARFFERPVRRFFNVPGSAAFAFIMSITSGYPMGPRIIADMRKEKTITRFEADRMMTFCSTSGPLFMLGAVGAGMLGSVAAGWVIAISHYLAAVMNGLIFRHHGPKTKEIKSISMPQSHSRSTLPAVIAPRESMVSMLTESIYASCKTLGLIGGYIVIFTMLVAFMDTFHLFGVLPGEGPRALAKGVFEFTVGSKAVAEAMDITLLIKCVLISAIISFGGISTHFQVASITAGTDINIGFYIRAKLCHGLLAAMVAFGMGPVLFSMAGGLASRGVFAPDALDVTAFNIGTLASYQIFINKILFSSQMIVMIIILFTIITIWGRTSYEITNMIKRWYLRRKHERESRGHSSRV